jgi:membrane protease YdiL (CAAX protease family)
MTSTATPLRAPAVSGPRAWLAKGRRETATTLSFLRGEWLFGRWPSVLDHIPVLSSVFAQLDRDAFHAGSANTNLMLNPLLDVAIPQACSSCSVFEDETSVSGAATAAFWSVDAVHPHRPDEDRRLRGHGFVSLTVSNLLQNGFSEEFLFRGALLTRLRLIMAPSSAIVVSSVAFGLSHIALDL